jgi:hypothetical protein
VFPKDKMKIPGNVDGDRNGPGEVDLRGKSHRLGSSIAARSRAAARGLDPGREPCP